MLMLFKINNKYTIKIPILTRVSVEIAIEKILKLFLNFIVRYGAEMINSFDF